MDLIQKRRLDTSVALAAISTNLKRKNNKIKFKNLSKLKFLKNNTPLLIGGADSFYKDGKIFLNNINKEISIILSGSNAFKNFKKLNLKLDNKVVLILSGSEFKKISDIRKKNFLKKNKIDYLIVEKDFLSNELKNISKSRIIFSDSVALNPLLLIGKILINLSIKKLNIAFFDGDFETEKGKVVMEETENSLALLKRKLEIMSLTKTFLNTSKLNLWNNDKLLHTN